VLRRNRRWADLRDREPGVTVHGCPRVRTSTLMIADRLHIDPKSEQPADRHPLRISERPLAGAETISTSARNGATAGRPRGSREQAEGGPTCGAGRSTTPASPSPPLGRPAGELSDRTRTADPRSTCPGETVPALIHGFRPTGRGVHADCPHNRHRVGLNGAGGWTMPGPASTAASDCRERARRAARATRVQPPGAFELVVTGTHNTTRSASVGRGCQSKRSATRATRA
jgi:hypothetical protein